MSHRKEGNGWVRDDVDDMKPKSGTKGVDHVPRARVLVVGAGAAGTAAAWCLSNHSDKFDVHVWEKSPVPGGVASSCVVKNGELDLLTHSIIS